MEEIDTKKIDIILQELTTKIADLKQNESDIQDVISKCYSLQEELIIFKHRILRNLNHEIHEEHDLVEKNQTNLIDAIEIEEFEEIIETKAEETKQKKKIDEESLTKLTNLNKYDLVFSHMSPLLLIITKLFNTERSTLHVLWYTHPLPDRNIKKLVLYISLLISDKVVTASNTSFPIKSKKVSNIGHAIDYKNFYLERANVSISKFLILSRISKSKNLDFIIDEFLSSEFNQMPLDIIGDCLTPKDYKYKQFLVNKYSLNKNINFIGKVKHENLSSILSNYDVHFNATNEGFYDKSVLETMANGIINFYCNSDYSKHFSKEYQELLQFKLIKNSLTKQLNKVNSIDNGFLSTMVAEVQKNANKESLNSIIFRINDSIQSQSTK